MAGGSEYESIRDDHFYTSLLLGCRRGAAPAASTACTSASASVLPSSTPSTSLTAPAIASIASHSTTAAPPQCPPARSDALTPEYQRSSGSPDSVTATSAGDSTPAASPLVVKSETVDDSKHNPPTHAQTSRAASTLFSGDHDVVGGEYLTRPSFQRLCTASVASSVTGSANSSPKSERHEAAALPPRKTKRRFRKATHTIRKEEKEHLLMEIAQLQTHIAGLKRRAINAATAPEEDECERDKLTRMATRVLRDAVQTQQREFAKIQAMMSEYTLCNIRAGSPLQTAIRLKRNKEARRLALAALKRKKLLDAEQFLLRRRPSLDPCKPMCEDHRYELPSGDFCSTRFTTIQFEGVHSVRQVFDLLVEYFCNIEICISEKLGHITIREDDDGGGVGIAQNCLVSMTNSGLPMESNTVLFSEFYDPDARPGHEQGHGLIVAEFVEEDERHPYNPRERIRRDVSAILELTAYTRTVEAFGRHFPVNPSSQPQEVVVVMTRWVYSKLRYPDFPIARAAWEELRDNMDRWGETMHRTLVESLRTSSAALS